MKESTSDARYIKIALDVCNRIIVGEYPEGALIKGRSVLASLYGVSPETIRKSMNLLEKEGVVEIKRGVGIFVLSVLHAQEFFEKWKEKTSAQNKYEDLLKLLDEKKELDARIDTAIHQMKDSFTYQSKENIRLYDLPIPSNSWIDGKSLSQVYFYNYTEATIVAVVSTADGLTHVSPGPDYVLHKDDRLVFVAKDKLTFDRVVSFLVYGVENR